jgi:NDP-sugar pyrophosphorylase family protein
MTEQAVHKVDVILLCGGKGSRLRELHKDLVPKSLYRVGGKALIEYTIDSLPPQRVGKLIFAAGHHAAKMKAWLQDAKLPYEVVFTESEEGILAAVRIALKYATSETVVICNTDEMRDGLHVEAVLDFHALQRNVATMPVTRSGQLQRHRVLVIDPDSSVIITSTLKPLVPANERNKEGFINIGFIVIEKNAARHFDVARKDWSTIIDPLIERRVMRALPVDVQYFNVGTIEEYEEAAASIDCMIPQ